MGRLNFARMRTLVEPGSYGDGGGLYLQVRGPERRSWLFRYKMAGKARLMGLGAFPDVSLAEARAAATAARKLAREGKDPIDNRRMERAEAAARAGLNTFAEVASAYIAAHEAGWRNAKHRAQWRSTLGAYAVPVTGALPVVTIDTGHVTRILEPIWQAKPETASRLRGRIETVLDYAAARGWRVGDNPARWRGHLANLLPSRAKLARVEHHAALPWQEIGGFMAELRDQPGTAALALRFAILTAARTGEVIGARWHEIDMQAALWTVPADRMKAGREHRVPLSGDALDLLRELARLRNRPDGFVFPGAKPVEHGAADAAAPDGARPDRARVSLDVPGLGSGGDELSARCRRGGPGSHAVRQGGGGLSARRPDREAPAADGGMGRVLRPAGDGRNRSPDPGGGVTLLTQTVPA